MTQARIWDQEHRLVAAMPAGVGPAAGVLNVRYDTLARYDARTAAALLRASDITSSWP